MLTPLENRDPRRAGRRRARRSGGSPRARDLEHPPDRLARRLAQDDGVVDAARGCDLLFLEQDADDRRVEEHRLGQVDDDREVVGDERDRSAPAVPAHRRARARRSARRAPRRGRVCRQTAWSKPERVTRQKTAADTVSRDDEAAAAAAPARGTHRRPARRGVDPPLRPSFLGVARARAADRGDHAVLGGPARPHRAMLVLWVATPLADRSPMSAPS